MIVIKHIIINKSRPLLFNFLLIAFFILLSSVSKSQGIPEFLDFSGRAVFGNKDLAGAVVSIYKYETIKQESKVTGKNGKFSFQIPLGFKYKVTFSAPGYLDMFLLLNLKDYPKERTDIDATYKIEVPFIETGDPSVRADKYKNAITKVEFNGKRAFTDNIPYLQSFTNDMIVNEEEQKKIALEKAKKEQERNAKMAIAAQHKKDSTLAYNQEQENKKKRMNEEEKRKFDEAEKKRIAKQKAKDDSIVAYADAKRTEEERLEKEKKQSMESEALRLKREAEEKALAEKKNKDIKANQESELLRIAAENERKAKEKALHNAEEERRALAIIEQMKRNAQLKAETERLAQSEKQRRKREEASMQFKSAEVKRVVKATAAAEKAVRLSREKIITDVTKYVRKETPCVTVTEADGFYKKVRTTTVKQYAQTDIYRKERTIFGSTSWYKNDKEIDELIYNTEVQYYHTFAIKNF